MMLSPLPSARMMKVLVTVGLVLVRLQRSGLATGADDSFSCSFLFFKRRTTFSSLRSFRCERSFWLVPPSAVTTDRHIELVDKTAAANFSGLTARCRGAVGRLLLELSAAP